MSVQETPLTPAEIYEKINGGPGLGPLRDSQDTLSQLRRLMENSAADVRALNSKISEGFQGAAGRAAANATRPLSKATEDDLDHLAKVDGSVSAQVTAFSIVQNSVQPVSAQPPRMTKRDTIDLIFGASGGFEQKFSAWVAAGQANIQAFSAYYDASTADKQNAPSQFGQVVDPGSQVDMTRSGSPGIAGPVTPAAGPGKPTGGHGNYSPTPKPVALEPSPVQPTSSVGNTGTPSTSPTENDGTSAATYTPSSGNLSEGYQFGPTGSLDPRANPDITGSYGSKYGIPGYYVGTGTLDPLNEGGAPGGGSGYLGEGRGSGAGPAEEKATTRGGRPGTAGNTGKPGQSGMAGMGHGGRKEEDKERKRPDYLRNPDPDGTFASPLPKAAPPVIGER